MDYRVDDILNKYNGELPKVYDQKINDHIKEIGEALGWTEIVNWRNNMELWNIPQGKDFATFLKPYGP